LPRRLAKGLAVNGSDAQQGHGLLRLCCPACGHCLETMGMAESTSERRKQKRLRVLTGSLIICPSCGAEGRLEAVPGKEAETGLEGLGGRVRT